MPALVSKAQVPFAEILKFLKFLDDITDIACDSDNNILAVISNNNGTLTVTSSDNVQLYQTTTAVIDNNSVVALTSTGAFMYAKQFSSFNCNLSIDNRSVYVYGLQPNADVLTVTNNVAPLTETYDYPQALAGDNGYIYRYNMTLTYNAPDPYSVGTTNKGSDNFAPLIGGKNPVSSAMLKLNGNDRFEKRVGDYFNLMQPYHHHTCIPKSRGINVYSFALKPEEHQPSGSCNFSRIDNSQLQLTYEPDLTGGTMLLYAVNYNVLRVMSGMAGLAYSN